jgi:hypothetical protein
MVSPVDTAVAPAQTTEIVRLARTMLSAPPHHAKTGRAFVSFHPFQFRRVKEQCAANAPPQSAGDPIRFLNSVFNTLP